jgi:cyclopropane fatty-acyl-phospholipid synthase-like methyltransferase
MIELYSDLRTNKKYDLNTQVLAITLGQEMIDICTKTHSKDEAEKSLAISHYISFDYIWTTLELLEHFGLNKAGDILDAGSGRGVFQFWLAKRFDMCKIISFDRSVEHSNDWISARKEKLHLGNIDMKSGNLKSTEFAPCSFDAITSTSSLEHNEPLEIQMIFNELSRIIKKDGRLIFTAVAGLGQRVWRTGISTDPVLTIYSIDWWIETVKNSGFKLLKDVNISEDDVKNSIEDFNKDHPIYANRYVPFGMHLIKG